MGFGSLDSDGMEISLGGDWGCGGDGGFSLMMVVDGVVSGLRFS
jgi:hypothetical protein